MSRNGLVTANMMMSAPSSEGRGPEATMAQTLARAKSYMQKSDYARAIVLLQRARNMCQCIGRFHEKHEAKEHSSSKPCLRESILLTASTDEYDDEAMYKAATGPCSCGVPKLSCDDEAHMDVLDKLSACSAAMNRKDAAIGFAAAAIHLNAASPVGYCRLSKLIRTKTLDPATLRSDIDTETLALAIVRHGIANVKNHGDVKHPLYKVLRTISRKLYRQDPFKILPPELKVMILSHLTTLELVRCQRVSKRWLFVIRDDPDLWKKLHFIFSGRSKASQLPAARVANGMIRLVDRATKACTLSIAPLYLSTEHYERMLSHAKQLRHLHVRTIRPIGKWAPSFRPPTQLTRISWFMQPTASDEFLDGLVRASSSTLEELQLHDALLDPRNVLQQLPKLTILRLTGSLGLGNRTMLVDLDTLSRCTPKLEQLYVDGMLCTKEQAQSEVLWPCLKVLVVGRGVTFEHSSVLNQIVSSGIEVIDVLIESEYELFEAVDESTDWPELRFFRCCTYVDTANLARILGPSLRKGNLKTLSVAVPDKSFTFAFLDDVEGASHQVQALGLHFSDAEFFNYSVDFLDYFTQLVEKFPAADTFAQQGAGSNSATAIAALLTLRSGTKRIFDASLSGVYLDDAAKEAKERKVELIRMEGLPCIFPWRLHDESEDRQDGSRYVGGPGEGDVIRQWKTARGVVQENLHAACQPFFRE